MRSLENRYQNQPWHIKLWRRRYYIMIPYLALSFWFKSKKYYFKFCWSVSVGLVQSKMKWYYTTEEVFGRIKKRTGREKD